MWQNTFSLKDDNLTFDIERAKEIFRGMIEKSLIFMEYPQWGGIMEDG